MMGNFSKQKGLFDEEFRLEKLSQHGDPLEKLNRYIDWEIFRPVLSGVFNAKPKGIGGCPPYDYVMMFKILILQRFYNISDSQTEYQINDRLTFMRFLGLTLTDKVPDEKTIWHFRECLTKSGAIDELYKIFNRLMYKKGLLAKEGTIVDASFVDVPVQRNKREENKELKEGKVPEKWEENPNKLRQKDVDAKWAVKYRERHYGYKNHVKISKESKFIVGYHVSSANVHDSQCLEKLLDENDKNTELYGDSAYSSKKIREMLAQRGIKNKINEKGYRGHRLTEEQKARNKIKSKVRVRVEHTFGFIQNTIKGDKLRSIGIKRAEAGVALVIIVYNLYRYQQIMRLKGAK